MIVITREEDTMTVKCPECGADVGHRCARKKGRQHRICNARYEEAEAAIYRLIAESRKVMAASGLFAIGANQGELIWRITP